VSRELLDQFCRAELNPYVRQLLTSSMATLGSKNLLLTLNAFDVELNGIEGTATLCSVFESDGELTLSLAELAEVVDSTGGAVASVPKVPACEAAAIWEADVLGHDVRLVRAYPDDSPR
jgi:hypothetical protein